MQVDKITDKETVKLGFNQQQDETPRDRSAPRFYARGWLELNCKTTIREMLSYIVTETGAMEAEQGCHDDTVMSLALANWVHRRMGACRNPSRNVHRNGVNAWQSKIIES